MPRVTIPGVGDVNFPDTMSRDDIMSRAEAMQAQARQPIFDPRDLGLGQLIKGGFNRSVEGLKGTALDLIPALGASIIGKKDYAKEQLEEYKARMAAEEAINPTGFKSYKEIRGPSDALGYAAETFGELGPDIGAFLTGAGAGSVVAKKIVQKGLEKTATTEAKKLALTKAGETGAKVGLGASSGAINIPDTLNSVYQDTGEIRPGLALTVGSLVSALDTYLPAKMLSQLGAAGKERVALEMLKKSKQVPTTWKKAFGVELLTTMGGEGLTESTQEALQIMASQIAGDKDKFFSADNVDRIINSGIKGAIGGGMFGAPGAAVEAKRTVASQQQAIAQQQAEQQNPLGPPAPIPQRQTEMFGEQPQATPYNAREAQEDLAQQTAPTPAQEVAPQQMGLDLQGGMTPEQQQVEQQNLQNQEMNQLYMDEAAQQQEKAKQRAITAKQMFDQELAATDERVSRGELNRREAARLDLLHPVLENIAIEDTTAAFQGNLKRAGYANLELTDVEKSLIARANDVKAALRDAEIVQAEPSLPNQLTPKITGIAEKGEKGPAGEPKPPAPVEQKQLGLPGIKQPRANQVAAQETQAKPEPEAAPIQTVLDANMLSGTGLNKTSGFFKQLLNKDMANPADQSAVADVLARVRTNKAIAPSTKQAIESIANQAFTALSKQGEMFGPRGGILKEAEAKEPKNVRAKPISTGTRASVPVPNKQVSKDTTERAARPEQKRVGVSERPASRPNDRKESKPAPLKEEKVEAKAPKKASSSATKAAPTPKTTASPAGKVAEDIKAYEDHIVTLEAEYKATKDTELKQMLSKEIAATRKDIEALTQAPQEQSEWDKTVAMYNRKIASAEAKGKTDSVKAMKEQLEWLTKHRAAGVLRTGVATPRGMGKDEVINFINKVVKDWTNSPKFFVYQSIDDLGPKIAAELRESGNATAPGFYDEATKSIIVIADNAIDAEDVARTIAHEATGHFGLRAILGTQYKGVMDEIYNGNGTIRTQADAKMKNNPSMSKELATEEVLADIQEDGGKEVNQLKGFARLMNLIRNFFRMIGVKKVSDTEVLLLLKQSRDYVISGKPPIGSNSLVARESFKNLDIKNIAFRNHPNVPGVTGADAQSIFDRMINYVEDAGILTPSRADKIHEFLKNGTTGAFRTAVLSSLPVNALSEVAEKGGLKDAGKFNTIIKEHSGYVDKLNRSIEPLVAKAEDWAKFAGKEQVDLFNKVVYDSTTLKVDPENKLNGDVATQAEYDRVLKDYNSMTPEAKTLYKNIRDAYGAMYAEIIKSIEERINTFVEDPDTRAKIKEDILSKLAKRGEINPYFALTRKGNYWLSYNEGGETYVEAFETERERKRNKEELEKGKTADELKLLDAQEFSKISDYKSARAPSGSFVNKILKVLELNRPKNATPAELKKYDEAAEEVMNLYLSTLPETSFAQSFQKRKDTLGYRRDAIEALRDRMYSTSQQLGRMKYTAKLNKLLDDFKEYSRMVGGRAAGDEQIDNKLLNEYIKIFEKHADYIINPKVNKISSILNSIGFNYLLGFNISSAVVNLSQVPLMVAPYLAGEHGWGDTYSEINKAYKLYLQSGMGAYVREVEMIGSNGEKVKQNGMPSIDNYSPDSVEGKRYATLLEEAQRQGQMNRSQFYDILEVDGRKNWGSTLNATSGFIFHHGERANRQVTMVAAYNLKLNQLNKKGVTGKAAELEAANYAINISELTNGGVSASGAPLIAKNSVGKVLFMFKRYGVSMYYLLFKTARDALKNQDPEVRKAAMGQLAGIYGMAALFAGLQGLPMFGVACMIYNLFADEDEDDMETATRKYVGEGVYKGLINYTTGLDIASRVGLNDLIFRTSPNSNSATFEQALLETLGGPVYGVGSRLKRGYDFLAQGNIERGVENILPSSISNVLKGFRYGTEGAKTLRGDLMVEDISAFSAGAQMLGFAPAELTRQQAINAREKGVEKFILEKKTKLLQRYNISNRMGDFEAKNKAKEELKELNKKHPGLGITEDTFISSAESFKQATKEMVNGVRYNKKLSKERLADAAEYN
jgi:hypothetical protein